MLFFAEMILSGGNKVNRLECLVEFLPCDPLTSSVSRSMCSSLLRGKSKCSSRTPGDNLRQDSVKSPCKDIKLKNLHAFGPTWRNSARFRGLLKLSHPVSRVAGHV